MKVENLETFVAIAERAEEKALLHFDRLSLMMDLEIATAEFDLRVEEVLKADDFNFAHDIIGIQNHIDRESKTFRDFFRPRYSAPHMNGKEEERACRSCGCTWNNACPGGCYWVDDNLCSCCAVADWD